MSVTEVACYTGSYCEIETLEGKRFFGRLTRLTRTAFELVDPHDERGVAWMFASDVRSVQAVEPPRT